MGALTYVLNVRFSYGVVRPAAGPEAVKSGVKTGHHLRIVDYDTGDGNALWYKLSGKAVFVSSDSNGSTLPLNFKILKHETYINCHIIFH